MKPINVSNTTLSFNRKKIKFDAKQAKRHDFGDTYCVVCDKVFTKYHSQSIVCDSSECVRLRKIQRRKTYSEKNREKIKAQGRAYYKANREKISAQHRAHHKKNRKKINARKRAVYCPATQREYHEENREKRNAQSKAYGEKNREKIKAQKGAYREKNREKIRAKARARYYAKKDASK